ncbi:MAG: ribosome biogenesis GTPase Der [Acidobacteria bacterium]|nr:ribosome biogenesis GTPase Der [Acidobacteriota bacterium]MDW7984161.1 ribosome biogenesis GTPase Der [Acidobacteriota bacterium]
MQQIDEIVPVPVTVTLIGRPNVGKSTLFNRLTGRRQAIVTSVPGTTRDRREGTFVWNGLRYRLYDTGGLLADETEMFQEAILEQCRRAIEESAVVWLVVDGREGLTVADTELMTWLRKQGKPVWVLVNKLDTPNLQRQAAEFYRLGPDRLWAISAETGLNLGDLLDELARRWPSVPEVPEGPVPEEVPRIAIIGRPNVGKSSLVNRLLGYPRVIVSEIPGTTRDVVDVEWRWDGHRWILLDTAGHKKRSKARDWPERVSLLMLRRALVRSDLAWLVLDATQPIVRRDRQLAGWSLRAGKGLVVLWNKVDLVPASGRPALFQQARELLQFVAYAPVLCVSALTGEGLEALVDTTEAVWHNLTRRVTTGVLNRYLEHEADTVVGMARGRPIRLKYITQVSTRPPTFALFLSRPGHVRPEHLQKIEKWLRTQLDFTGTPIRLVIASRKAPQSRRPKSRAPWAPVSGKGPVTTAGRR